MYIKKYCITLILLLFGLCATYSQERRTEICVDFRVNSTGQRCPYAGNHRVPTEYPSGQYNQHR